MGMSKWASGCDVSGLKVDGPGRDMFERASSESERPTQSLNLKAQIGKMADFCPAITKNISEVGKASDDVVLEQGIQEGLEEVNDDGVVRVAFGFEDGEVGNVLSVHDRSIKRKGRKKNHPVKSHGMITRHSKALALDLNQDSGKENIVPNVKKASWNLKEEIAKVIKAGVVLGFDFNGREKDMIEEIVKRIKAGTFGKVERFLPCINY